MMHAAPIVTLASDRTGASIAREHWSFGIGRDSVADMFTLNVHGRFSVHLPVPQQDGVGTGDCGSLPSAKRSSPAARVPLILHRGAISLKVLPERTRVERTYPTIVHPQISDNCVNVP